MSHNRLVKKVFKAAREHGSSVGVFFGMEWIKQKLPILLSSESIRDLAQERGEPAACC